MRKGTKIALVAAGLVAAGSAGSYAFVQSSEAMPALASLPVGEAAPNFRGNFADGRVLNLADFRGKTVVLEWNNPGCPSVKAHYDSGNMQRTQAAAAADGVVWLTINSGAKGKQGHMTRAEANAFAAKQQSRSSAYLLDPQGVVGRAYGATATPHMYVVDAEGRLVYRGAIDDKPNGQVEGARNHVLAALGELKAGKPVSVPTTRAYGCNVKYKA